MLDDEKYNSICSYFKYEMEKTYNNFLITHNLSDNLFESGKIDSDIFFGKNQILLRDNKVSTSHILRIVIDNKLFSFRAKCLYDEITEEDILVLIDFKINKIYLRCGGFGATIVDIMYNIHNIWLKQIGVHQRSTKIMLFKFMSAPF